MHRIRGGRFTVLSTVLALSLFGGAVHAANTELAGVAIPAQTSAGAHALVLNGAGIRSKLIIKVYVAALYAPTQTSDANALIDSTAPRRMRLYLLRTVDSQALDAALQNGLRDNTPANELTHLQAPTARFSALMNAIGSVKQGDTINLDFNANGVSISHDGQARGQVDSAAFARALMRVWLGDKPVQTSLKKALLGN